ncbi:MAG: nitroreductase family protein [Salinivirgaceae bacterium]|jgi:nitroreductase|nr:nitroreductase family protein [Salinivirgaceae bacterium]
MDFKQLVLKRYSCRSFLVKPVSDDILNELFETCRFAPSAVNFQPWKFIVVNKPEILQNIHSSYKRSWIETAPIVVIALADKNNAWHRSDGKNHADIDLSIFIDHFTLAATAKELATCWVCNFDVQKIIDDFAIPEYLEPIALIPLGYPDETVKPEKKRKNINEFVYYNSINND